MKKGFTLIELLVVVLIIGILASVALPQYNKAVMKSRVVEMVTFLENIQKGVDMLMVENGSLVNFTLDDLNVEYKNILNCTSDYACTAKNGNWSLMLISNMSAANVWGALIDPAGMDVAPQGFGISYMQGTFNRACTYKKNSGKGKMFCEAVHSFDNRYTVSEAAA